MSLPLRLTVVAAVFVAFSGCDAKPAQQDGVPGGASGESAALDPRAVELMQVGLNVHNFYDKHKRIPLDIKSPDGTPLLSWRVELLEVLDPALYQQFHLQEAWDSPHNSKLMAKVPRWYASVPGKESDGQTTVMMFNGPKTAFQNPNATMWFAGITDGLANTILAVESGPDKAVPWTKPADLTLDPAAPLAAVGQTPDTGMLALFYDGQVRLISDMVPPADLAAMVTATGGETVVFDYAPSVRAGKK